MQELNVKVKGKGYSKRKALKCKKMLKYKESSNNVYLKENAIVKGKHYSKRQTL